ncbi:MAG: thiamine phosphate synthase [Prevotella sp.]|nr:thiamine phosphate synthase [Prevotella sp.]MDY6093048.1 thiamine phosphate synthase [Prevotella sp.]
MSDHPMIQFISHYTDQYSYLDSIRLALEGGCRWVQLRMKDASIQDILSIGKEVRRLCDSYQATFILDDHVELVREIGADGVHLGKKDMPVAEARKTLGNDCIIGGTANTFDDVKMHYEASANYIGCGPFRFTTTKQGLAPVLGLEGYRSIIAQMSAEGIDLPMVAIGGITAEDIPAIMQTGVSGIALSGAVLRAADPVAEMKRLTEIVAINKEYKY